MLCASLLALTLVPAACTSSGTPEAAHASPEFVLAEETIGPLKIGMRASDFEKHLGPPSSVGEMMQFEGKSGYRRVLTYDDPKLLITVAGEVADGRDARAVLIVVLDPGSLALPRGLRFGSSAEEVRAAYGSAVRPESDHENIIVGSDLWNVLGYGMTEGRVTSVTLSGQLPPAS